MATALATNEGWKKAAAVSHHAKADALTNVLDALSGIDEMVGLLTARAVQAARSALEHERDNHERAARLIGAED